MFGNLEIFKVAQSLAIHSASRHSVIAQNIANADTPGYMARDIAPFTDSTGIRANAPEMRATRGKHLGAMGTMHNPATILDRQTEASPNGNSVSLESEMVKASGVRHKHELALSVYSSSLNILRTSLGRR